MELADEMGAQSLKGIFADTASCDANSLFEGQLDDTCKSCWAFLEMESVFHNAESFHHARQDRGRGNLYSTFNLDLGAEISASAASIDLTALTRKFEEILALRTNPRLIAIDLAATEEHQESVMLIVRHGGDLSSVYAHRDDGSRHALYYRPQDEIVLIYTAAERRIEVLGRSFGERHDVSNAFAELVLGQNVSEQPLSEKVFDLGRFTDTFELEIPSIEGVEILSAAVTEFELLLGSYSRRAALKVTKNEDIDKLARKYLAGALRFRGGSGIHRVAISVEYRREDARRSRNLNITIRGSNGSNIQSYKRRDARELGSKLLSEWGILQKLRPLDKTEASDMLPGLMRLFELGETVVTGLQLVELGLSVGELLRSRLVCQKARQRLALADDETDQVVEVDPSFPGPLPSNTIRNFTEFKVEIPWLKETLAKLLAIDLDERHFQAIGNHLVDVGRSNVQGQAIPVYLARGLSDFKTIENVEGELQRHTGGRAGILLYAGLEAPRLVGNNVVVPVLDVWNSNSGKVGLDLGNIAMRFQADGNLPVRSAKARVVRGGTYTGNFVMPPKKHLPLTTAIQINFFEKLAEAYNSGVPDVYSGELTAGTSARSPREVFTGTMRERVFSDYVEKGSAKGFWRLKE